MLYADDAQVYTHFTFDEIEERIANMQQTRRPRLIGQQKMGSNLMLIPYVNQVKNLVLLMIPTLNLQP